MPKPQSRVPRPSTALSRALRYVGLLVGIIGGWEIGSRMQPNASASDLQGYPLLFAAALGALLFLVAPYVTLGFFDWLHREIRRLSALDLVAAGVGLLVGGVVAALLAWPLSLLPGIYGDFLPALTAVIICSVSVIAVVTKKRELQSLVGRPAAQVPGFLTSNSHGAANDEKRPPGIVIDTSVVIDGRIVDLAATGILMSNLIVPQFVLRELQLVADSPDPSKRDRGRRGLDVLERLRQEAGVNLIITNVDAPEENDVDAKLVRIARLNDYWILTGDSNLERVAQLQEVRVLNIHQLAHVLRPPLVPGELMSLKIVQAGREFGQGVGFLTDGTMVVVEAGKSLIGQDVKVVVTRTLQTGAGRMAFAQVVESEPD